jgi:hypothetical protein
MNSRERFLETMRYGKPDRVPYFEEGIRREVLMEWRKQGLPKDADIAQMFPSDHREVIEVDLEPRPKFKKWPTSRSDLKELFRRLVPYGRNRLPRGWARKVRKWKKRDYPLMLRIHRGFFLSMGVYDWRRFSELMDLLIDDSEFVREAITIQGDFSVNPLVAITGLSYRLKCTRTWYSVVMSRFLMSYKNITWRL